MYIIRRKAGSHFLREEEQSLRKCGDDEKVRTHCAADSTSGDRVKTGMGVQAEFKGPQDYRGNPGAAQRL